MLFHPSFLVNCPLQKLNQYHFTGNISFQNFLLTELIASFDWLNYGSINNIGLKGEALFKTFFADSDAEYVVMT